MTTVLTGIRAGRYSAKPLAARLFAGVAIAMACCGSAVAQDLPGPDGAATGDEIWSRLDDDIIEADATSASVAANEQDDPSKAIPTGAVAPVQGTRGQPDDDPFAAPGIVVGSFILRPTLELGLTGQRETTASESGAPPVVTRATARTLFSDTSLRLQMDSDWERHMLNFDVQGAWQRSLGPGHAVEPQYSANATGRLDIGATTTLTGTLGYGYELDDAQSAAYRAATDPSLIPAVTGVNDPATQTLEASLTLRQEAGRFFGEAGISAAHTAYGKAELSDGSIISQGDLDNTTVEGTLRAGFEASAVFAPFVEATYGVRRMVHTPDSGGVDRDAERYALRAGTEIDFGEKLNGEISVGYVLENLADLALADISGAVVGAEINWSPRRETDVVLELETTTETSGNSGSGGAMLYTANLGVTHRMRANLTAEAGIGAEHRDVRAGADETTLSAELAMTYWFNRFAGLTTRIGHEETLSPDPAERSRTTSAYLGLRLQR